MLYLFAIMLFFMACSTSNRSEARVTHFFPELSAVFSTSQEWERLDSVYFPQGDLEGVTINPLAHFQKPGVYLTVSELISDTLLSSGFFESIRRNFSGFGELEEHSYGVHVYEVKQFNLLDGENRVYKAVFESSLYRPFVMDFVISPEAYDSSGVAEIATVVASTSLID